MKYLKNMALAITLITSLASATGCVTNTTASTISLTHTYNTEGTTGVIELTENKVNLSGSGITYKDGVVTVSTGGTFVLRGIREDTQVYVDAKEQDVTLVLDGVTLSNNEDAPIFIKNANNMEIILSDGTTNTLSDMASTEELTDEIEREGNATLFSKEDLTISGDGTLIINAYYKNGITSKDNLTINSGNFIITADNNGIIGKDSLTIYDGNFSMDTGNDGFQSDNDEENLGYILIEDGTFDIISIHDGIQAESLLEINGGDFNILTNEGYENAPIKEEEMPPNDKTNLNRPNMADSSTPEGMTDRPAPEGMADRPTPNGMADSSAPEGMADSSAPDGMADRPTPEGMADRPTPNGMADSSAPEGMADSSAPEGMSDRPTPEGMANSSVPEGMSDSSAPEAMADSSAPEGMADNITSDDESNSSHKGLKANNIIISNGNFTFNTYDDSIHSNDTLTINNGIFNISTGDDAMHADNQLTINNGSINIIHSYEGIESLNVTINDGDINLYALDDGINGASYDKSDKSVTPNIEINGGNLYLNTGADGLDSNGTIYINDGYINVTASSSYREHAIDADNNIIKITNGTVIALDASGSPFKEVSTQPSFVYGFDNTQNDFNELLVSDSNGNVIASITPTRSYSFLNVSSPLLVQGETYTITNGTIEDKITLNTDSTITSNVTLNTMQGKPPKQATN